MSGYTRAQSAIDWRAASAIGQAGMAQEQEASGNPSWLTRVFGSRIAQALGIFGVGFTLFQGLEPFLRFSRLMAYLVNHWRELTRALWSWLASFVHLDLPAWALDLLIAAVFHRTLYISQCPISQSPE